MNVVHIAIKLKSHDCYVELEMSLLNGGNIKSFWNIVNSKCKENNYPKQFFYCNAVAQIDPDISGLFAQYFYNVYVDQGWSVASFTHQMSLTFTIFMSLFPLFIMDSSQVLMGFHLHCWGTAPSLYSAFCLLFLTNILDVVFSQVFESCVMLFQSLCRVSGLTFIIIGLFVFENMITKDLTCLLKSTIWLSFESFCGTKLA